MENKDIFKYFVGFCSVIVIILLIVYQTKPSLLGMKKNEEATQEGQESSDDNLSQLDLAIINGANEINNFI